MPAGSMCDLLNAKDTLVYVVTDDGRKFYADEPLPVIKESDGAFTLGAEIFAKEDMKIVKVVIVYPSGFTRIKDVDWDALAGEKMLVQVPFTYSYEEPKK